MSTVLARSTDPQTSHDAGQSLSSTRLTEVQTKIVDFFKTKDTATDEQLEQHLAGQASPSSIRTRRAELVAKGVLFNTGQVHINKNNRRVTIWGLTQNTSSISSTRTPYPGKLATPVLQNVPSVDTKYKIEFNVGVNEPLWVPSMFYEGEFSTEKEALEEFSKYSHHILGNSLGTYRVAQIDRDAPTPNITTMPVPAPPAESVFNTPTATTKYRVEVKMFLSGWQKSNNFGLQHKEFNTEQEAKYAIAKHGEPTLEYRAVPIFGNAASTPVTPPVAAEKADYIVEVHFDATIFAPAKWMPSQNSGLTNTFTNEAAAEDAIKRFGSDGMQYRVTKK